MTGQGGTLTSIKKGIDSKEGGRRRTIETEGGGMDKEDGYQGEGEGRMIIKSDGSDNNEEQNKTWRKLEKSKSFMLIQACVLQATPFGFLSSTKV